jgi:hypothetical protein
MPKPDPSFNQKCAGICAVYRTAPALAERAAHTVSGDEITTIQAPERAVRSLPMTSGHVERREFEYIRRGTEAPIAALMSPPDRSVAPSVIPAPWRVVRDNVNTHLSDGIARLAAELCGIEDDLGEKGKSGILRSVVIREALLRDPSHRITFDLPKTNIDYVNPASKKYSSPPHHCRRTNHGDG